jgi:hypothetical protein
MLLNSVKIKELLPYFRVKKDEFDPDGGTWYEPKSAPNYTNRNGIYLYFKAGKVDKIKINILTDHITVVSEHTGQELYKDKLKQAVIEFKTAVIKQYFGPVEAKKVFNNYYNKKNVSIKDLMFQIKNKQYVFYNTWSPNEDLCTIIFKILT